MIRAFFCLAADERRRLAPAVGTLLAAHVRVRSDGRRWVRTEAGRIDPGEARARALDIRRAARVVPARCLVQAIAGARLLQRAGLGWSIKVGVRKESDEIGAHAWLLHDGEPILGGPMDDHAVLREP